LTSSILVFVELALLLLALDVRLVAFLTLTHEVPKDSHLVVVVLIEVEPVAMAEPDLEEVVIQTLLGDLDFSGCVLQGVLDLLVFLVDHS
jgi:hypothetical protein